RCPPATFQRMTDLQHFALLGIEAERVQDHLPCTCDRQHGPDAERGQLVGQKVQRIVLEDTIDIYLGFPKVFFDELGLCDSASGLLPFPKLLCCDCTSAMKATDADGALSMGGADKLELLLAFPQPPALRGGWTDRFDDFVLDGPVDRFAGTQGVELQR